LWWVPYSRMQEKKGGDIIVPIWEFGMYLYPHKRGGKIKRGGRNKESVKAEANLIPKRMTASRENKDVMWENHTNPKKGGGTQQF